MRLTKIKLAGFKSFVDPTTVYMKSNLVGVVGPNGSGKSNVIDAVRWVMGESSAKHLRGESMADVIFNGSTARKPVGQASIEMVFDNSDGSLGGQWAQYNEISVKRQVSRDGQSNYYLNGAKCRRRDITDIFLGTGLGPRSYAIIEQGMISRLIEAKPEDLRVMLEEAAGISKYKERRRETETRMRHTRENLERITDLREELGKQLERLQRQARTAERYKELKSDERLLQGQLMALQWRAMDEEAGSQEEKVSHLETELEAAIAGQRSHEAAIERQLEAHTELSEQFNEVQARYYEVGGKISAKEQSIQHSRERRQQLERDLNQVEQSIGEADAHQSHDRNQLVTLEANLERLEPQLAEASEGLEVAQAQLEEAEGAMGQWQADWEGFNQRAGEPAQMAEVERTRITHMEEQSRQLENRYNRLQEELGGLSGEELEQELAALDEELVTLQAQAEEMSGAQSECIASVNEQRAQVQQLTDSIATSRNELQQLSGRVSSLEALQESALARGQEEIGGWLSEQGLTEAPRLAQGLEVSGGWESAVETVLGEHLEAICVDSGEALAEALAGLDKGQVELFETSRAVSAEAAGDKRPLSAMVTAPWPLDSALAGVYCADSLNQALALRDSLAAHESVITPEGVWLGRNWLRVNRSQDAQAGVLARERELKELNLRRDSLESQQETVAAQLEEAKEQLAALEEQRENRQLEINQLERRLGEIKAQRMGKQTRLDQVRARVERISAETGEIQHQIQSNAEQVAEARGRLEEALENMERLAQERETLNARREELKQRLEESRQVAQSNRQREQELRLELRTTNASLEATRQNLARVDSQLSALLERRDQLKEQMGQSDSPMDELQQELEILLQSRIEVENQLTEARRQVEAADAELRTLNGKKHEAEAAVNRARENLQGAKMDAQTVKVRRQGLQEQMTSAGYELKQVFEALPGEATIEGWSQQIEELGRKISRLGAINLAAIDEYKEQSERKTYLDSQHEDLMEALTTLENAIRKIDRETRARFKETFDLVNDGLKRNFPKLFGGGQAYLELTGEDLLDTGVSIMARPPGKRISNIHLLSGGEKALTAVALVFSIFELNPAPFCMLDEVDAPLDEANVGRFCELVKAMSEHVQFIFITHNKATMEIARHLNGVTMSEPGVSRLVAVDVEEAAELAAM